MNEADEDFLVANDAEACGRHDIAEQLRARHIGADGAAVLRLVEDYRIRLGLLPWAERRDLAAQHAAELVKVRGPNPGYVRDRGSGRSTRAILEAIARCRVYGRRTLVVVGRNSLIRKHCEDTARDFLIRLQIDLRVVNTHDVERLRGMSSFVSYEDHIEFERGYRSRSAVPFRPAPPRLGR